jgi:SNF2 family DNA or RNA helicase
VNSIEERIEGILKEKRELFIEYIDGMETYPSKISREALKRILDLTSFDVDGEILE